MAGRDLGNQASPVDRAHNEEALNKLSDISFFLKLIEFFKKIPLFSNRKTHCSRLREITSWAIPFNIHTPPMDDMFLRGCEPVGTL